MITAAFYNSPEWRQLSERARARDQHRCTVARLLGGTCGLTLHAHHIDRDADPLDLDNVGTTCDRHHPVWEALRRAVTRARRRSMSGDDATRSRAVRAARRLVRNIGAHIETEDELTGALYGWGGYLREYENDDELRERMVTLWRQRRAEAAQLELLAA